MVKIKDIQAWNEGGQVIFQYLRDESSEIVKIIAANKVK